jgi:dihydrofolate reductase
MKVICSMVITPNGYIARLDGQEDYASHANWLDYLETAKEYNNFVIGRKTLDIVNEQYNGFGFEDVDCQYKVVVSGQNDLKLDPTYILAKSPQDVIDQLSGKVDTILLVGGSELNTAFAKQGLIDEVIVTIVPHVIGQGINLFSAMDFELELKFESVERLSEGRIKIRYLVDKSSSGKVG